MKTDTQKQIKTTYNCNGPPDIKLTEFLKKGRENRTENVDTMNKP